MQLNKVLRGVLIALSIITVAACSSPSSQSKIDEQNRAAAQQAEADRLAREAEEARIRASAADRVISPEEQIKQQMADLETQVVYFDFDRATVSSDYQTLLDKHAAFLVANTGVTVVVEGHCDSRGTPEYNIALGERRAKAIETYLRNAGVSGSQISVVSFGEEKPVAYGSSASDFAKNRRGVLVYK